MTLISRKAAALTSTLAVGALLLAGCSGPADGPAAESDGQEQPQSEQEPAQDLAFTREDLGGPSEEHFGDLVWATEIDQPVIGLVRGDRVIATRAVDPVEEVREVLAFGTDGQEAWSAEYEEGGHSGSFLEDTFAVEQPETSEAEGLTGGETTTMLRLLSYADGSVTQEFDREDVRVERGWVASEERDGNNMSVSYDESSGEERPFLQDQMWHAFGPDQSHYLGVSNSSGALWGMDYAMRVPSLGLALFTDQSAMSDTSDVVAVDMATGEEAYRLQCDELVSVRDGAQEEFGSVSPNGEYAAYGNIVLSATEGHCYGGDDSGARTPEFTAIDDEDGPRQSVMMPFGAEASQAEAFDGPAPIGVLDGGLAVFEAWTEGGVGGVAAVEVK